ncbi:MAG: hypothetical protein LC725_11945 [Lentisphaerae bacterium]|nr:hypothetical protein [Lentisphaerota bacterium]
MSKSIDEGVLWERLTAGADPEEVQKLSDIHFASQEVNEEYIMVQTSMLTAMQSAHAVSLGLEFYQRVLNLIQGKDMDENADEAVMEDQIMLDLKARQFARSLLERRDIFALGPPSLLATTRGLIKKTALAFAMTLFLTCMVAFVYEWLKQDPA